jgi:amino acid transporter
VATPAHDLPRELGLPDLALTRIRFIVGLPWVGRRRQAGPAHVFYWMIAAALFYVPSAVVVIHLNRLMPLEGGLYQWAKLGFNELTGFAEPAAVRVQTVGADRADQPGRRRDLPGAH